MALNSRGRIEFFVSLQIAQLQAGYIFRRKLPHFLLLEIQYFQCFCLQGTYFNYSHFQILLVWDSYPLILLGCFILKVFLFFLSVDKNQYILLQKETPSNLKYVQLQKLRGTQNISIFRLMHQEWRCCSMTGGPKILIFMRIILSSDVDLPGGQKLISLVKTW